MTLKELRLRMQLSQEVLARQVGVAHMTYTCWELGKHMPTSANLQKLSEILGEAPSDIVSRDVGRPISPLSSVMN